MMAGSTSEQTVCARAWLLNTEFDVAEHPQLANPDTNRIFPEYVKGMFRGRAPYLAPKMKAMSSLSDSSVASVLGIFHG
jgi:hypothetical protein